MSLEGRIRDVGLAEVCQLLALSRKSGTLHVRAPLLGLSADVVLAHGAVADVTTHTHGVDGRDVAHESAGDARALTERMLALLEWTDGEFAFEPGEASEAQPRGHRVALDRVLVEAAERAEGWSRVRDRVPHAHVVPAFVDAESQQLPLLRLVPQEWEILTRVDGLRTVAELAHSMRRDTLDVATHVHALIGAGLLTLRAPERRADVLHEPDPSAGDEHTYDLWIPDDAPDIVFDPLMPGEHVGGATATVHRVDETVASPSREPSLQQQVQQHALLPHATAAQDVTAAVTRCRHGDEAARRGDLDGALTHWQAALQSDALPAFGPMSAARVREAASLVARLRTLLHEGS